MIRAIVLDLLAILARRVRDGLDLHRSCRRDFRALADAVDQRVDDGRAELVRLLEGRAQSYRLDADHEPKNGGRRTLAPDVAKAIAAELGWLADQFDRPTHTDRAQGKGHR